MKEATWPTDPPMTMRWLVSAQPRTKSGNSLEGSQFHATLQFSCFLCRLTSVLSAASYDLNTDFCCV